MFMTVTVTQGLVVHFMTDSLTLWLGCSQLTIKMSLLVMQMLITLSDWHQSLLLIGTGVMLFIFAICQAVNS